MHVGVHRLLVARSWTSSNLYHQDCATDGWADVGKPQHRAGLWKASSAGGEDRGICPA